MNFVELCTFNFQITILLSLFTVNYLSTIFFKKCWCKTNLVININLIALIIVNKNYPISVTVLLDPIL